MSSRSGEMDRIPPAGGRDRLLDGRGRPACRQAGAHRCPDAGTVDRLASGASAHTGVGVQISLRAQYFADMAELVYAHA